MTTIQINGHNVNVRFTTGFFRRIGEKWGCTGPIGVYRKFSEVAAKFVGQLEGLDPKKMAKAKIDSFELSFETLDAFADVLRFVCANDKVDIEWDDDQWVDFILENIHVVGTVIRAFMDSMAKLKPGEEGKLQGAETTTAPK